MTRPLIVLIVTALAILSACGGAEPADPNAIAGAVAGTVAAMPTPEPARVEVEVTRIVEVTKEIQVTRIVEATRIVEVTPQPTDTPPVDQAPVSLAKFPAQASQTEGGLELAVTGVSLVPLADMPSDFRDNIGSYWESVATVIAVSVAITNTTDSTRVVYPDQGTLVAGNQQADADIWASDRLGGEIFSGVTKAGVVLFGVPNPVDLAAITSIRYIVSSPSDGDYNTVGDDFDLNIPLTNSS